MPAALLARTAFLGRHAVDSSFHLGHDLLVREHNRGRIAHFPKTFFDLGAKPAVMRSGFVWTFHSCGSIGAGVPIIPSPGFQFKVSIWAIAIPIARSWRGIWSPRAYARSGLGGRAAVRSGLVLAAALRRASFTMTSIIQARVR
jgi:hypothetical protein